jgi:hypothetical protein
MQDFGTPVAQYIRLPNMDPVGVGEGCTSLLPGDATCQRIHLSSFGVPVAVGLGEKYSARSRRGHARFQDT